MTTSLLNRFWVYQKERFPLHQHGPLVAAFSFCAVTYAAKLDGRSWSRPGAFVVAFVTCLLFFLQLRIADEFKDAEEDARWRPYRPVPRGLIQLKELGALFVIAALIQGLLAAWMAPALFGVLLFAWLYLGGMSFEFGCRNWLKERPIVYLVSHMLIMPIVDFFGTACDWVPLGEGAPHGLEFFLAGSFCNGIVIEFGRKIRSRDQEEEGVETYSVLWGPRRAALAWAGMLQLTAILGLLSLWQRQGGLLNMLALLVGLLLGSLQVLRFCKGVEGKEAKRIETLSGVWTLIFYLSLAL